MKCFCILMRPRLTAGPMTSRRAVVMRQRGGGSPTRQPDKLIFVRFLRFTFVWPKTICCCRCQLDSGALRPLLARPPHPLYLLTTPFHGVGAPVPTMAPGHFSPGTYLHCLAIFKQFQLGCLTWLALLPCAASLCCFGAAALGDGPDRATGDLCRIAASAASCLNVSLLQLPSSSHLSVLFYSHSSCACNSQLARRLN